MLALASGVAITLTLAKKKEPMKTLTLIICAVLATELASQAEPQRPRVVEGPRSSDNTQQSELSRNYTVTVKGSIGTSDPFDVILRGSSSRFSAELVNPSRAIEIILREGEEAITVTYTILARIAVKTGENSTEYKDTRISGSFLATLGKSFPVLEVGGSSLTVQIDQVVQK